MQRSVGLWAWPSVALILCCALANLANAASLSLHAAQLSPTLALLSWSAPTPATDLSWLSNQHSSARLSLTDASLSHLIVTGAQSDDSRQGSSSFSLCEQDQHDGRPSSAGPPCAHATLPASSSALPMDGSAAAPWHLSGARLSSSVRVSPADPSVHRVSWSAVALASSPSAPPLLYSLFAEWTAPTVDASELSPTDPASQATIQPTLIRHAIRMCSAQSHSHDRLTELHCDIDQHRLPRGVELTLHLITECDYHQAALADPTRLPHCLSAVSPSIVVTLPLATAVPRSATGAAVLLLPVPSLADVRPLLSNNDSVVVHDALCRFFNLTSGFNPWYQHQGWCDNSGLSYCQWFGLSCNAGEVVTMNLGRNGLGTPGDSTRLNMDHLFLQLPRLQFLNLSGNFMLTLSSVNVSTLSELHTLDLSHAANSYGSGFVELTVPLVLPSACNLLNLNLGRSFYAVSGLEACASLQQLNIGSMPDFPFDFESIVLFRGLTVFDASGSTQVTSAQSLTILEQLSLTNPVLEYLDISATGLEFSATGREDNWPHVASDSLRYLAFGGLAQLATLPSGPVDGSWLIDLPQLQAINISNLPNAFVDMQAFATASATLQSISMENTAIVGGGGYSLGPVTVLNQLQTLVLDATNIVSTLPTNVSSVWPQLTVLSARGCNLEGPVPTFEGLPLLTTLLLSQNNLIGDLSPDFVGDSQALVTLDLSQNQLTGDLPDFANLPSLQSLSCDSNGFTGMSYPWPYLPSLQVLTCSNNQLAGFLDQQWWSRMPQVSTIDLSSNMIEGVIPSPSDVLAMDLFSVGNNQFNSPMPTNIIATVLDLRSHNTSHTEDQGSCERAVDSAHPFVLFVLLISHNTITGPVILLSNVSFSGELLLSTLNLESTLGLTCPIRLAMFDRLSTLVLANGGFAGCDFTNASMVSLPHSNYLGELDISRNEWAPMVYLVPSSLSILRASEANVQSVVPGGVDGASRLQSITLNGNALVNPLMLFSSLFTTSTNTLRAISCSDCGFDYEITQLFQLMHPGLSLESLDVSGNDLSGRLPPTLFSIAADVSVLPLTMRVLDLSNNPRLSGPLPVGDSSYSNLQEIDVSGTNITGSIPQSWDSFSALQRLTVLSTQSQCILQVTVTGQLVCRQMLGAWIRASSTSMTGFPSIVDPTAQTRCPAMSIAGSNMSTISMDPSYHARTLCVCDTGSFGLNGRCYSCPEGCTCSGAVIQNCFPVLQLGLVSAGRMDSNSNRFLTNPQSTAVMPFELVVMLPCPRTVTGQSLCNPDGIPWTHFYNVTLDLAASSPGFVLGAASPADSSSDDSDLSGWCYPGHTGRLCAQCTRGYFSSGRWCLRCLSEGVHVVILIANLLVIVALIAYLFFKSPKPSTAVKALAEYRARMRADGPAAPGPRALLAMPSAADRSYLAVSDLVDAADADAAEPVSEAANPLKLLIFHSQQLSLLLQTTASMPNVIAGLMSAVSSGSNGFSLSSLVAMECLNTAWSMQHRCWLAIVAPMIIAAVAGLTFLADRHASSAKLNRGGRLQFSKRGASDRQQALLADDAAAVDVSSTDAPAASSSPVPRIYGVCVSLLYLLVFPCAQTALSALTCTDTRERTELDSRVYLNLFPAQQCDDEWSRAILPPALLGALFWLIVFPLCSTLMLRRLQAQLQSASVDSSSAALSAWPICSDLLSPYSPRFWYWEQILLMRRLMLVAAVTIIPASSLYLPLALFALIQLCALLQHWTHPFAHAMINAGELVSLYLLLLNYISALILQTGLTEGGFHQTADAWAVVLFLLNFAFLSALVIGLFGFIRKWTVVRLSKWKLRGEKAAVSAVRL